MKFSQALVLRQTRTLGNLNLIKQNSKHPPVMVGVFWCEKWLTLFKLNSHGCEIKWNGDEEGKLGGSCKY